LAELQGELVGYAKSEEAIKILKEWYLGTHTGPLQSLKPTLDEKWSIITGIIAKKIGTPEEIQSITEKMKAEDQTDRKKEFEYKIKAITATPEEREALWADYMSENCSMSYHMGAISMSGFNSRYVPYEVREKFHERYWEQIPIVLAKKSREMAKSIFWALRPRYLNNDDLVAKLEELGKQNEKFDSYWKKELEEDFDMAKRCNKALKFAES